MGSYIIRPSSKGPDHLAITWLFFKSEAEKVIVHLTVKEEVRHGNVAPKLILNGEIYDSLDEISEKYI